jgi:hypothetical protein
MFPTLGHYTIAHYGIFDPTVYYILTLCMLFHARGYFLFKDILAFCYVFHSLGYFTLCRIFHILEYFTIRDISPPVGCFPICCLFQALGCFTFLRMFHTLGNFTFCNIFKLCKNISSSARRFTLWHSSTFGQYLTFYRTLHTLKDRLAPQ